MSALFILSKNARIALFLFVRFICSLFYVLKRKMRIPCFKYKSVTLEKSGLETYYIQLNYKKIYLSTNNTASTYISGVIFLVFPQIVLITT